MCYTIIMLYFDNASTTKISKASLESFVNASEVFYNPSSLYAPSVNAKKIVEEARTYFLKTLKAKQGSTILFTGSATESNNAVLNSVITRKDKKYIFSAGEHSSIYETAKKYKEDGYNVVYIPLNSNGSVNMEELEKEIDSTTALISIIYLSNETGAVNDIKQVTTLAKSVNPNVVVHTDAVQALGKVDVNLKDLGVDYLTISAHKINGPKGIGALYIANPNKFKPFIYGGGQEMNMRAGTENVPAIAAFKTALEQVKKVDYSQHKKALLDNIQGDYILVSDNNCIDNIISICFKGVRGETIEHIIESKGYLIGTGSACNSKAGVNRVLQPIVNKDYIEGAIRISFGEDVTIEDCANLGKEITKAVSQYRERIKK